MKTLAIETSCDETSVAILDNRRILSNILATQIPWHAKYGGVVPDIARRKHKQFLPSVLSRALKIAQTKLDDIDVVAVTIGPGLAIALEVGISQAIKLSRQSNKPLVAVNHMEGHLLSVFAQNRLGRGGADPESALPMLSLLISGGHTEIVLVKAIGDYEIIAETLDDAIGEAYDKVGRMLKLGYPAGQVMEKLAQAGRPRFKLPVPMLQSQNLNFSFSGLKTAVLYQIKDYLQSTSKQKTELKDIVLGRVDFDRSFVEDMALAFQISVCRSLIAKLEKVCRLHPQIKAISLGGGVAGNAFIRGQIRRLAKQKGLPLLVPYSQKMYSDNAGMIGLAGYYRALAGKFVTDPNLDRVPNLRLGQDY